MTTGFRQEQQHQIRYRGQYNNAHPVGSILVRLADETGKVESKHENGRRERRNPCGKALLKASAVRRLLRGRSGVQVSPEAVEVLDRHVKEVIEKAEVATVKEGRRRLDGVLMRRVLHR